MISDRYLRVLVFGVLLLTSTAAPAKSDFEFSDFVITASKFQRILWREFLIAFPNLYTKKNHRIFNTGTVVFYDSEQRPALLFFANQRMNERKEGTIARITIIARAVANSAVVGVPRSGSTAPRLRGRVRSAAIERATCEAAMRLACSALAIANTAAVATSHQPAAPA